ncbi:MAG: hypothetical protein EHM38_05895 [Geobacteraceae bacterium]|nr:MAG: hypothetical protein EHM38_10555 [Geobacteraceae bacterium]RPI70396.1 MAG: hypothetical protein EHM38_05895 [Geobacteraceae bacterium]RPJ16534.1 MAG: hypothetical protein EHM37_01990 [Deltaproteobacteria bacterium]
MPSEILPRLTQSILQSIIFSKILSFKTSLNAIRNWVQES